jgi:tetratricopeptide (TPR) repeat protein
MRNWTLAMLAEKWPKVDGSEGVNITYVQDIEAGRKRIADQETLRQLAGLLDIPLWEFGYSEYNPFAPDNLPGNGKRIFDETLDTIEHLIRDVWSLRCAARIVDAEQNVKRLNKLFDYYGEQLPPPSRLYERYQLLSIQVQRLNAVTELENKCYDAAIEIYKEIIKAAKSLDSPSALALGLEGLGKELERKGDKAQAVSLLEDARDASLSGSKILIAFVHSYLSRVYASAGDEYRFERAVNTGLTIARSLKPEALNSNDYVYSWSPVSSMLAEQSWGYLNIDKPEKTLAMREEIEQAIYQGQDARLHAWIPLDWARAYLMLGDIEQGIQEAKEFYRRVSAMKSPHAIKQTFKYLAEIEDAGYGDIQVVKDFREELQDAREK